MNKTERFLSQAFIMLLIIFILSLFFVIFGHAQEPVVYFQDNFERVAEKWIPENYWDTAEEDYRSIGHSLPDTVWL